MAKPVLQSLALFARHRYRLIFVVAAVVFGLSIWLGSRLRFDSDVLNLLPKKEPVVEIFRQTMEEFGSTDVLIVAIRIPEGAVPDPYEVFAEELGMRLQRLEGLSQIDFKIGEMGELIETFLPHSVFFLDADGRQALADKLQDESIDDRVRELRHFVDMPQALAVKELLLLDPLGLSEIFFDRLTKARAGFSLDWASGYFLSQDRRMILILARPVEPPQNVQFSKALVARVQHEIEQLRQEWPVIVGREDSVPPEVVLGGRHVIGLGDDSIIRRDALTNVLTSMGGVLILFLFAFRRFGLLIYAFVPLCMGLAVTFGISALLYGTLSAATSGVAALLIGLGIDFVIVSYGRYVEERQRGVGLSRALATMSGSTGRAVVVGGVTSAATFLSFGVTDFTGLYQMGYLTGVGILICMVAVLVLLPAMLAWAEDRHEHRQTGPKLFLHGLGSAHLIRFALRRPWVVLIASVAITLLAGRWSLDLRFEDSIQAMRPKGNPGVAVRDEVAERFGRGFDQMMLVVTGPNRHEVLEASGRAADGAKRLVEDGVLTGYDAMSDLIPAPQQQRMVLDWLEKEREGPLAMDRIRQSFAEAASAEGLRIEPFLPGLALLEQAIDREIPIGAEDFQHSRQAQKLLRRYLLEQNGYWKSVVYLYPPAKTWRREPPPQAEKLAEDLGPLATLTGANVVSRLLRRRVLNDALVAAVLGFVLVGFLLWLDYRRLSNTILSLAPLVMGIVWMLGAMVALDIPMNFMNIFVSTMIIGIGVDYGVHMIHRFREFSAAPEEQLDSGLVETGKAIVLAALSTTVGFGSLSFSHYPGLQSMGRVAILGAVTTALVSITVLPSYLAVRRRRANSSSAG